MRDISYQIGADAVSDLAHPSIVNLAAVGRSTGHENLGSVELRVCLERVIVNQLRLGMYPVRECLEVRRDGGDPMTTSESTRYDLVGEKIYFFCGV